MAISLLKLCTTLGLKRPVSICRDVLGFEGRRVPAALVATRPQPEVRLKRFADLLKGQHFHVHIIVAGSDLLTENDQSVLDYAVFRLRDIYSAAGIGVLLTVISSYSILLALCREGHHPCLDSF